ncbi:N-acetylglucosamine-1-phosphotransferase subunits alpha/beta isoform X1 [Bactrocera neohumeralis]|uniref:N-acetylglucosamine-1-phosphotransferase subunits alpha/beta n=1 Tax=Bactrocera tryoni TaxID=59916 RepID=UPI001A963EAC|nr:N-acetylglucosamine-1-phosphotransferase subunits alpha/beta [Bactrocera tryoni]XP_050323600.1 N-acetylglucosamine-1-phosphotransferase subunits alpha/beta isoform X1 [Bactrocera neohumeralis]
MRIQRKWGRMLKNNWKRLRRRRLLIIFTAIVLALMFFVRKKKSSYTYCEPIDVVYTWVNGSDPMFIDSARRYNPNYDPARFDDKNELRYSLRSLEMYAPWVRHVYIVTNGQIPYWLDLSFEKVTVVPHELLTSKPELLPTFSSSAIETFIHRIPHLSQRFLYLNDDIFLGAPLYPEDLYTNSEGVRIYQAWMVPDCAEDCPWTYIGDGACDRHCNIAKCQYDGGDCNTFGSDKSEENTMEQQVDVNKNVKLITQSLLNSTTHIEIRHFPLRKKFRNRKYSAQRNGLHFRELVLHKNLSTLAELRRIVDNYNSQLKSNSHANDPVLSTDTLQKNMVRLEKSVEKTSKNESSKDIYSHSLIYTNMLLNRFYGFKARNVLAHVGFLLDRNIIYAMQQKFLTEVDVTLSNRFRSTNDLQFAFIYYSFLMSETTTLTVGEVFDEFDTDDSHTWSDREVRTFLARMYPLPLDWSAVRFFEEVVSNCSRDLDMVSHKIHNEYTTLVYERYEDSTVPTITRELVEQCRLLAEALETNFATRSKYKFNIIPKRAIHNNFMMLTSNITDVVDGFDKIRRNPRKFNCINDNLEPLLVEDNELIRHLLEDFYLSFFPRRSSFELQFEYRNRFTTWHDYQRWRRRKRAALVVGYAASVILILFIVRYICIHKTKFVRRYVQSL